MYVSLSRSRREKRRSFAEVWEKRRLGFVVRPPRPQVLTAGELKTKKQLHQLVVKHP